MAWRTVTHARRYRGDYPNPRSGHLYKFFAVQSDDHFLTVGHQLGHGLYNETGQGFSFVVAFRVCIFTKNHLIYFVSKRRLSALE